MARTPTTHSKLKDMSPKALKDAQMTSINDGDEDEGTEESLSKKDLLDRYMAGMSFRPKKPRSPKNYEYYRVYSDPNGKVGRIIAVVRKDVTGSEPERPEYFTITLQIHVDATQEAVDRKAPDWSKKELSNILNLFNEIEARSEVSRTVCGSCAKETTDFTTVQGTKLCPSCIAERFANG